jgi:phenylalanine-4-hydroxylase
MHHKYLDTITLNKCITHAVTLITCGSTTHVNIRSVSKLVPINFFVSMLISYQFPWCKVRPKGEIIPR